MDNQIDPLENLGDQCEIVWNCVGCGSEWFRPVKEVQVHDVLKEGSVMVAWRWSGLAKNTKLKSHRVWKEGRLGF